MKQAICLLCFAILIFSFSSTDLVAADYQYKCSRCGKIFASKPTSNPTSQKDACLAVSRVGDLQPHQCTTVKK